MKGTLHLPRKKVSQDELQAVVSSNKRAGAMAEAFRRVYGTSNVPAPSKLNKTPIVFQETSWTPGNPEQAINRQKRNVK